MTPDAPSPFEQLLQEGLAASRSDQTDTALALFVRASEADPSSGVPHFLIGSEQAGSGDFAAAELSFACAVLLAPGFALARYQLGLLQFSSQRAPLALLTWQPLFDLPEDDALHHFVRGFAALAQDTFDEALRHFRAGIACRASNPALCADVLQVIDAIEHLGRREEPSRADEVPDHVLLSAYGRGVH